jgi:hypothetical protein
MNPAVIEKANALIAGIRQSVTWYEAQGWTLSEGRRKAILGAVSSLMPGTKAQDKANDRHLFTKQVFGDEHWADLTDAEVFALGAWAQIRTTDQDGKTQYERRDGADAEARCILDAWGVEQKGER